MSRPPETASGGVVLASMAQHPRRATIPQQRPPLGPLLPLQVMALEWNLEEARARRARAAAAVARSEQLARRDAQMRTCEWCGARHFLVRGHDRHTCSRCPERNGDGARCRQARGHGSRHNAGGRRTWTTS